MGAAGSVVSITNEQLLTNAKNGNVDAVREILASPNVDLKYSDIDGWTPLMLAIKYKHYEVCCMLINAGADVNKPNHFGVTPLSLAKSPEHADMKKALLNAGATTVATDANNLSIEFKECYNVI